MIIIGRQILILSLMCLMYVSCAAPQKSLLSSQELYRGMSKSEALSLLGVPQEKHLYQKSDQSRVECLFYKDIYPYQPITPVCFENEQVIGWGMTFFQDEISQNDKRLK